MSQGPECRPRLAAGDFGDVRYPAADLVSGFGCGEVGCCGYGGHIYKFLLLRLCEWVAVFSVVPGLLTDLGLAFRAGHPQPEGWWEPLRKNNLVIVPLSWIIILGVNCKKKKLY